MASLACPQCNTKLTAPAEVLGQPVRCTQCGGLFTASTTLSPYLEGLPPAPKDRRPYILAGGVLICLLLVTGLVLTINYLEVERTTEPPGAYQPKDLAQSLPPAKPALVTKDGTPIELPDATGPDRVPPPGEEMTPALRKVLESKAKPTQPKPMLPTLDEVTLTGMKWDATASQRTLIIGYQFHNGSGPTGDMYSIKLRMNGGPELASQLNVGLPATGTLSFQPGAGEKVPKVEAWVEKSVAGGLSQKVSNTLSTE